MILGTSRINEEIRRNTIRYEVLPECAPYHEFRCEGVHLDLQVGHHVWYQRPYPGYFHLNDDDPHMLYQYVDTRQPYVMAVNGVLHHMRKGVILIPPGVVMLMHSVQAVGSSVPWLTTTLDGRSTLARFGLHVHLNAGHGEPGFDWVWVFEVLNNTQSYFILTVGAPIASLLFAEVKGDAVMYPHEGRYQRKNIEDWTPELMLPRRGNL